MYSHQDDHSCSAQAGEMKGFQNSRGIQFERGVFAGCQAVYLPLTMEREEQHVQEKTSFHEKLGRG